MDCSTPGLPVHHQLLEFTQTHAYWVSDAIQPTHPLSSPSSPPSIFPSIRVFSNESVLHFRWPKYWSFSLSISLCNEYSGLISFRVDWLDLLAVQGTLKSLLQHHSSKTSILRRSAFFIVQLSHLYMTTGKTIALTRQTFIGKATYLKRVICKYYTMGFSGGSDGKECAYSAGDMGSVLGWEDLLEEGMATHCSILAWRIPLTQKPGRLQSMESQRVRHDWASNTFTFIPLSNLMCLRHHPCMHPRTVTSAWQ